jgi:hypothetical protein
MIKIVRIRVAKSGHQCFIKKLDKHVIREEDHIFIVHLSKIMIGVLREHIRCSKFGSSNMVKFNIITRSDQLPAGLAPGQFLSSAEIEKILMVGEHEDGMRISFKIMIPFS